MARAVAPRRPAALLVLAPLMLAEWFVVGFPSGRPAPHAVPAIYETPQAQSATAIVSLPDYSGMPEWANGADYLYYSTAHWRPIVNGFGRGTPVGHAELVSAARDFPSKARQLRALGVQYVVLHADRYADRAKDLLAAARASGDCRLVLQIGQDYLFEMLETPSAAAR